MRVRTKYRATKVRTKDGEFDSKLEYQRWLTLKAMENKGEISDLKRQVTFNLVPKQDLLRPRKTGKITNRVEKKVDYIADFVYMKNGSLAVEDAKGVCTPEYVIKRKLMLYVHGIQIDEIKK